jgi:YesN/AraC family two-component response regulator
MLSKPFDSVLWIILLKPIDPKELIAAVHKVQQTKKPPSEEQFRILIEHMQGKGLEKISTLLNQNFPSRNIASQQRRLGGNSFYRHVGYTAMMQQNETETITTIKRYTSVLKTISQ